MRMPNRVLVPVDGSPASLRALEHASHRKQRTAEDLSIIVLNVQAPLPPSRYVTRSMLRDHYALMSTQALKPARSTARRLKLAARFYVRHGDPAVTIARFARRMNCKEIIMGTRGRGRFATLVVGSVALTVVQLVSIPVTLVR
jgi:nucleotide-binding universal stress UspA family protein